MLNPATRRNSYLPALAATLLLVGCGSDSLSVAPQGFVNPPAPLEPAGLLQMLGGIVVVLESRGCIGNAGYGRL